MIPVIHSSQGRAFSCFPAAILVDSAERILLQRRTDFGIWGLPAGCPEAEETAIESITREVFEETGLMINKPLCIGYSSNPQYEIMTYPNGDVIHCYSLIFLARNWNGALIKGNDETLELAFFRIDALPEMLPNMRRSIDLYGLYLQTGQFQLD